MAENDLDNMWNEATQEIANIDPGKLFFGIVSILELQMLSMLTNLVFDCAAM